MLSVKPSPQHTTDEAVIAATLWLMTRYQQTRCKKLARMVEQHLAWIGIGARSDNPTLAQACKKLRSAWRTASSDAAVPSTSHH